MHFSFYLIYFLEKYEKLISSIKRLKPRERERERESDLTYIKYCESYYIKV